MSSSNMQATNVLKSQPSRNKNLHKFRESLTVSIDLKNSNISTSKTEVMEENQINLFQQQQLQTYHSINSKQKAIIDVKES